MNSDFWQHLMEASPDGITLTDLQGKIIFLTPQIVKLYGCLAKEDVLGTLALDWITLESREKASHNMANLFQGIVSSDNEFILLRKDGSRFYGAINYAIYRDSQGVITGMISTIRDISEKKDIITKLNDQEEQLKRLNRVYRVMSCIHKAINHVKNPEELYRKACKITVSEGGFRMAWIGLIDEKTGEVKVNAHAGLTRDYLNHLHISLKDRVRGKGPTGRAIATRKSIISNNIDQDPAMAPWRTEALKAGYRSSAAFPLFIEGLVIGTLNLYAHEPDFFNRQEVQLLEEISAGISMTLELFITQKKRIEAETFVIERQQFIESLINLSPDIIYIFDIIKQKNTYSNNGIFAGLGYTVEEIQGMGGRFLPTLMHPDDFQTYVRETYPQYTTLEDHVHLVHQFRMKNKNGDWHYFDCNEIIYTREPDGSPRSIFGVVHDITHRLRAEELLRQTMNRLIETEESMKRTAAQQLHDEVGQNLTALNLNLSYIQSQTRQMQNIKLDKRIADSMLLVENTVAQIRNIMTDLLPPMLDDFGLHAALQSSITRFTQRTPMAVTYKGKDLIQRLHLNLEYALFRMLQEALHNVVKHAKASHVEVALEEFGDSVRLTIRDNGIGFDLNQISGPNARQGFGLMNISEQMKALGGMLEIQTTPGQGTKVILEFKR